MSNVIPGGWTDFCFELPTDAKRVFEEAIMGMTGVGYTPHAFATQVVSGTNYCFLCKANGVYPGAADYAVTVYIYRPVQGPVHIMKIVLIHP